MLLLNFVLSIMVGENFFSIKKIFNLLSNSNADNKEYLILSQIRIPRTVATYFVGAGLAVTGCILQSIFLNPLCESYTLGVSSAAGLGVILGFILNLPLGRFWMSILGILFGLGLIYLMNIFFKKTIDIGFVLSGIVLNFLFSSIIVFLTLFFEPHRLNSVLLWLLGGFTNLDTKYVYISSFVIAVSIILLLTFAKQLDIMVLGKEKAQTLGVEIEKLKKITIVLSVIITTFCVSLSGVIVFVGIIVPNVVKEFVGLGHKKCIIYCAIIGALFVSVCDSIAKNILYPVEIPISVLTGIVGSIVFLFYLFKTIK